MDLGKTIAAFKAGDMRALSRLISLVESKDSESLTLMASLYKEETTSACLGITGPPGAGKSTLVDRLIKARRAQGKSVGILAIDPSSPFSGGAVLGDRIRMQQHASDSGVYIRSLGSRGAHGGLSTATRDLVRLYQAFGFDEVIVETVGVGQTELDIMDLADTTLVVLVPEAGDTIQTMKAGLTEIADLFVVNKCDRPGAGAIVAALQQMIELGEGAVKAQEHDVQHKFTFPSPQPSPPRGEGDYHWHISVLQTIATKGTGVAEIWQAVDAHRTWLQKNPPDPAAQRALREEEFSHMATEQFSQWLQHHHDAELNPIFKQLADGTLNPYTAVAQLFQRLYFKS
jgi:LAO/AO transport system kinase